MKKLSPRFLAVLVLSLIMLVGFAFNQYYLGLAALVVIAAVVGVK
ncbi:hypothetical protein ACQRD4_01545 [Streptococcus hyointestinalis]|uniref:Uncharacterized protein n=1 Tax=Streptococcus hyointestinalis TaxID=1337 RepID=A0A380K5H0_9STRE|nr:hypothetical protein [Streptococcus hyointestinalis]MDD6384623.1 hypothetical protein [Streptococcus hyointestinalis]MDD7356848.1 hypothetical protein [Streptococcus hyointestinalis]MDY4553204.1 hypothetical protein [Streptococcus hyointestinalis]SUN60211.1 Uncharacterised protein [Streptococcus hyointestinalis]